MRLLLAAGLSAVLAGCPSTTGTTTPSETPNTPPFGIDVRLTALEDVPLVLPAPQFSDPDGNALKTVIMTTLPTAGVILLDGVPVAARTELTIADAARLSFVPALNASGTPYASFTFQVRDDGGGSDLDQEPNRVTIDVLPRNDPPQGKDFNVQTVVGVPRDITLFAGTDPNDTPSNTITAAIISTLPGHGTLTTEGRLVRVGDAVNNVRFTPEGALSTSFTFQVRDNGGTANGGTDLDAEPNTLSITVIEPNVPPTGTNQTASAVEDTAYVLQPLDFGFSDTRHQLLFVNIESLPLKGLLMNAAVPVSLGEAILAADVLAGAITYLPPLNQNGADFASFTYVLQDDGGTDGGGIDTATQSNTLTIDVASVNDAPIGSHRTFTMTEDQADLPMGSSVYGFLDTLDSPPNALAAVHFSSIPSVGTLLLSGVPVTPGQTIAAALLGGLVYRVAPNATGNSSFTFSVQDDGGTSLGGIDIEAGTHTITFAVSAVNDPPTGTDATITIAEDTPRVLSAADFGFADAADSPPGTLSDITIVAAPGATLRLSAVPVPVPVANNQVISAASLAAGNLVYTPPLNAHGNAITAFTFLVRDNGTGSNQDMSANTITFNVTSVNDAPAGADTTLTFNEDTTFTFASGNFGFSDANDSPANAFASVIITTLPSVGTLQNGITNVSAGTVISDVTQLHFIPAPNGRGVAYSAFTFQVQDAASGTDPTPNTITFNVTNVVDPPSGQDNTVSTPEDTPFTFSLTDFGLSDGNDTPPNTITGLFVVTPPGLGVLTLSGTPVVAETFVPVANIGQLVYTSPMDATSTPPSPLTTFTFAAADNGSIPRDPTPNTIGIFVGVTNDPPTDIALSTADVSNIVHINSISVASGAPIGSLSVSDPDAPTDTAIFTLVAGTGDTDNARFSILGTTLQSAAALSSGVFSVRIRVTDGGGAHIEEAFAIVLRRAPSDIALLLSTVFENHAPGAVGTLSATDPDLGETFTFSLVSGCAGGDANNDQFQISGTQLSSTVVFNHETTPARSICVRVTDSLGLTRDEAFSIVISDINDAPSSANKTVTLDEDETKALLAADFAVLDADGDTLASVVIVSVPSVGSLSTMGTPVTPGQEVSASSLTYTPALDDSGASYASFSFRVRDDGGTANGGVDLATATNTITFDVNALNDPPVVNALSRTAHTHMPIVYSLSLPSNGSGDVSDPDNDGPTFSLASVSAAGCSGAVVSNLQATGTFTFAPGPGFVGSCSLSYRVSDGSALSDPGTISIVVSGPVIWFVSSGASSSNSGILGSPFPTLARVSAVHSAGQSVFVFSGTYTDSFALTANERVQGDQTSGATFDALFGVAPPAGTITRPTFVGTRPTLQGEISLASGASLSSFAANTLSASNLVGATVTGVSISNTANVVNNSGLIGFFDVDFLSTSTPALGISGGTGAVSFDAQSTITGGGVVVQDKGGDVRFDGPVTISSGANVGVTLTSNSGSVLFAGGLFVTSTTGTALLADAAAPGGTITVLAERGGTPLNNTLASSAGAAIAFHNTTVGPSGITWSAVNAGSTATNAVSIGSMGSGGRFNIEGGTLTTLGGIGILLDHEVNVRVANLHIADALGGGIVGQDISGTVSLTDLLLDGTMVTGIALGITGALTAEVIDSDIRGSEKTAITLQIGGGPVHATLRDNRIGVSGITGSGSSTQNGIDIDVTAPSAAVLVTGNTIRAAAGMGVNATVSDAFDGTFVNNSITEVGGASLYVLSGTTLGDSFTACVDLNNNTALGMSPAISLEQAQSTTVELPGFDGMSTVTDYLSARNAGSTSAATGVSFAAGPMACVQP